MPNEDRYHAVVLHCLEKAGWIIVKEQEYISIGTHNDTNRRLYIDIKAQRNDEQLVLVEVKGLERSPVHDNDGVGGTISDLSHSARLSTY